MTGARTRERPPASHPRPPAGELLAALVVALVVAAGAGAYFTATGSGSGSGSVGSPADLTIAALTPAAGLLYPGGTGEVRPDDLEPEHLPGAGELARPREAAGSAPTPATRAATPPRSPSPPRQTAAPAGTSPPRWGRSTAPSTSSSRARSAWTPRPGTPARAPPSPSAWRPARDPAAHPFLLAQGDRCRRRLLLVGAALLVAGLLAGGLIAYFSGAASAGSAGGAAAGTLPAGNTPTLALAGRDVTVTWDQTSFQGNPLGTVGHGGYVIARYAESAPGTPITPGAACDGTQTGAADPLSCTETVFRPAGGSTRSRPLSGTGRRRARRART